LEQKNTPLKKKTELKYSDANFSPDEKRANHTKYYVGKDASAPKTEEVETRIDGPSVTNGADESRGKKRARAEDFL